MLRTNGSSSGSTGRRSAMRWWNRATCSRTRLPSASKVRNSRHTCATLACVFTGSHHTTRSSNSAGNAMRPILTTSPLFATIASADRSGGRLTPPRAKRWGGSLDAAARSDSDPGWTVAFLLCAAASLRLFRLNAPAINVFACRLGAHSNTARGAIRFPAGHHSNVDRCGVESCNNVRVVARSFSSLLPVERRCNRRPTRRLHGGARAVSSRRIQCWLAVGPLLRRSPIPFALCFDGGCRQAFIGLSPCLSISISQRWPRGPAQAILVGACVSLSMHGWPCRCTAQRQHSTRSTTRQRRNHGGRAGI